MCHLILLMPILALPVFWLLPLSTAIPLYSVVFVLSVVLYAGILKAMRKPVTTGREGIIHVVGVVEHVAGDLLEVRIRGEHWTARSADEQPRPGDSVEVVSVDGLTLGVTRIADQRIYT